MVKRRSRTGARGKPPSRTAEDSAGSAAAVERRAGEKRRREDQLFDTLANYAPIGIFMSDAKGRCIYINPPWVEFMRRPAAELTGATGDQIIHAGDRARVMAAWRRTVERGKPFHMEYRLWRGDGSVAWVRGNGARVPAGNGHIAFIGTLQDITAAKVAELEAQRGHEHMQAVMDASPVAIMALDTAGRIRSWNKSAERMFGWTAAEVVGAARTVPVVAPGEFAEALARVARGGRVIDKLELCQKKNLDVFIASVSAAPLQNAAGQTYGLVVAVSDITEHERVLGELSMVVDARQQLLQDLHDGCIQSLFAIGLNLDNARHHGAADPRELVRAIDDAVTNLNLAIQELRGFISSSVETGTVQLREDLERAARSAGDEGPRFTIDVAPSVVEALSRDQLQQVLQISREGISNIIRHAGARTAAVSLRRQAGEIQLEIRDDGVGFDPQARERGGHGLNYIAARVRKLGGRWRIDSARAQGTRLVIGLRA